MKKSPYRTKKSRQLQHFLVRWVYNFVNITPQGLVDSLSCENTKDDELTNTERELVTYFRHFRQDVRLSRAKRAVESAEKLEKIFKKYRHR